MSNRYQNGAFLFPWKSSLLPIFGFSRTSIAMIRANKSLLLLDYVVFLYWLIKRNWRDRSNDKLSLCVFSSTAIILTMYFTYCSLGSRFVLVLTRSQSSGAMDHDRSNHFLSSYPFTQFPFDVGWCCCCVLSLLFPRRVTRNLHDIHQTVSSGSESSSNSRAITSSWRKVTKGTSWEKYLWESNPKYRPAYCSNFWVSGKGTCTDLGWTLASTYIWYT